MPDDSIREELDKILEGRIGSPYSLERLRRIYAEGESRFAQRIPPGFEDNDKDGAGKYGDLVLWFQILEYAENKKAPIIFITEDSTTDWWLTTKSGRIAHPDLVQELSNRASVGLILCDITTFLKEAQETLSIDLPKIDEALQETNEIRENERSSRPWWLQGLATDIEREMGLSIQAPDPFGIDWFQAQACKPIIEKLINQLYELYTHTQMQVYSPEYYIFNLEHSAIILLTRKVVEAVQNNIGGYMYSAWLTSEGIMQDLSKINIRYKQMKFSVEQRAADNAIILDSSVFDKMNEIEAMLDELEGRLSGSWQEKPK